MYEQTKNGVTPTETLTFMENQLAYGFHAREVESSRFDISLVGYKKMFFQLCIISAGHDEVCPIRREFKVRIEDDYFHCLGIHVHQSVGFFTTGVEGVSIVFSDKAGTLQTKYLPNNEQL